MGCGKGKCTSEVHFAFSPFFEMGQEESSSPFLTQNARNWSRNLAFKISIISFILLALAYFSSYDPSLFPISQMLLILVYFGAGTPSAIEAVENVLELDINIDVLMTVAAFSAFTIGSSFEGALLLVLFSLSGSIEEMVTLKAKHSLSRLSRLNPTKALVLNEEGQTIERAIEDVKPRTKILVKAGEIVPLDGLITHGSSSINLSHLTGEHMPVKKQVGSEVPAGSRLIDSSLVLEVLRPSSESTLAKIISMITNAQEARPKLQRWFDQFSRSYAIAIMVFSFVFALSLPLIFSSIPYLGREGSIYRALAFLIAASPCALILAVPIAYLSALGSAARHGIVLKGGAVWDALESCQLVALDKTGTLTLGELSLISIDPIVEVATRSRNELIGIAQAVEKNAIHPIAKSICSESSSYCFAAENFRMIPGSGVEATVLTDKERLKVFIGDIESAKQQIPVEQARLVEAKAESYLKKGTILSVIIIGANIYLLSFKDVPRPGVHRMLSSLEKSHRRLVMLTGDNEKSALEIASKIGLKEVYADLKPEDKLKYVEKFSEEQGLAMVGDGVNDAPALARATVGISMGQIGSSIAADVAQVILLRDNVEMLDWLFRKSKMTHRIVRENLILASLAILVAIVPALMGDVPLWMAVILHEGGTVLVGLNALRLLRD